MFNTKPMYKWALASSVLLLELRETLALLSRPWSPGCTAHVSVWVFSILKKFPRKLHWNHPAYIPNREGKMIDQQSWTTAESDSRVREGKVCGAGGTWIMLSVARRHLDLWARNDGLGNSFLVFFCRGRVSLWRLPWPWTQGALPASAGFKGVHLAYFILFLTLFIE